MEIQLNLNHNTLYVYNLVLYVNFFYLYLNKVLIVRLSIVFSFKT